MTMKSQPFFNKRTLIIGIVMNLFVFLFLGSNKVVSQNNFINYTYERKGTCVLVSFTGKRVEQINYLNCTIRSAIKGYYLVLEKSIDGETFLPLAIKKGQISPKNQVLQFSFSDDSSTSAKAIYKICAYKFSITNKEEQKYFCVSGNLLNEFDNSVVSINAIVNETQQEMTTCCK